MEDTSSKASIIESQSSNGHSTLSLEVNNVNDLSPRNVERKKATLGRKFYLICWKNFLLRKRSKLLTALEILLPLVFTIIFMFLRLVFPVDKAAGGNSKIETHPVENPMNFSYFHGSVIGYSPNSPQMVRLMEAVKEEIKRLDANASSYTLEFRPFDSEGKMEAHISDLRRRRDIKKEELLSKGLTNSDAKKARVLAKARRLNANDIQNNEKEKDEEVEVKLEQFVMGVVFSSPDPLRESAKEISYKLRPSLHFPPTIYKEKATNRVIREKKPNGYNSIESAFVTLQLLLDKSITRILATRENSKLFPDFFISSQQLPSRLSDRENLDVKPGEEGDQLLPLFYAMSPLGFGLLFTLIVPTIVKPVTSEKYTGIKELMKMAGLPNWMHWIGWFINSLIPTLICISLTVIILVIKLFEEGPLIPRGNALIWWIFFLLYIIWGTSFCFLMSALIEKPPVSNTVAVVIWLLCIFANISSILNYMGETVSLGTHYLLGIFVPQTPLFYGLYIMVALEYQGIGIQWNNLRRLSEPMNIPGRGSGSETLSNLHLLHVFTMFGISTLINLLLAIYLDQVMPSRYGVRKPWYFIFQPSTYIAYSHQPKDEVDIEQLRKQVPETSEMFEPDASGLQLGIEVLGLTKKYPNGKLAVDNLSLKIFQGQIFALLGHNGAGKTTTMRMLTGMSGPSGGTALINGLDIRSHLSEIRQELGFCPQHNMLFEGLTVRDHLVLFGMLKGLSVSAASQEIPWLLEMLALSEKSNVPAAALSGGQQRRLMLGCAIAGGSKVLFIDECSSGLDPEVRRVVWDLLLAIRKGRIIILTTHFLEEADILGDKVAIMSGGKVVCAGSSDFLKKYYGSGFTLSLTLEQEAETSFEILELLKTHVPSASIKGEGQGSSPSLQITLPSSECGTEQLPKIFAALEAERQRFKIVATDLAKSSLDEVFIKVDQLSNSIQNRDQIGQDPTTQISLKPSKIQEFRTEEKNDKEPLPKPVVSEHLKILENSQETSKTFQSEKSSATLKTENGTVSIRTQKISKIEFGPNAQTEIFHEKNCSEQFSQFYGLLLKRIIYSRRKWVGTILQILIPVLLTICGILSFNGAIFKALDPDTDLQMTLDPYEDPVVAYTSNDKELNSIYGKIVGEAGRLEKDSNTLFKHWRDEALNNPPAYDRYYSIGAILNPEQPIALYRQRKYPHSLPLSINLVSNTMLRYVTKKDYTIKIRNVPFPEPSKIYGLLGSGSGQKTPFSGGNPQLFAFLTTCLLLGGLITLSSSTIVLPIEERVSQAKQLQLMTGVPPWSYWLSFFLWDYALWLLTSIAVVLSVLLVERYSHFSGLNGAGLGTLFLVLSVYGAPAITFSYLFSFIAKTPVGGFALVEVLQTVLGALLFLLSYYFELAQSTSLTLYRVGQILGWVGRPLFPSVSGGVAIFLSLNVGLEQSRCNIIYSERKLEAEVCKISNVLALNNVNESWIAERNAALFDPEDCCAKELCGRNCYKPKRPYIQWTGPPRGFEEKEWNYFRKMKVSKDQGVTQEVLDVLHLQSSNSGIGLELFWLILLFIVYWALLLTLEVGWKFEQLSLILKRQQPFEVTTRDDDVLQERARVKALIDEGKVNEEALVVSDLSKRFGNFPAVSSLTFGVHKTECFGLLGVNGAGKTTTFKMLTGAAAPSFGDAFISSLSLKSRAKFLSKLGYCPQFDGIIGLLSGREMLELFGRLKALKDPRKEATKWLEKVGLGSEGNVECGNYSGGMKRRLSAAMALIGDPKILLLDEPTSGVDPVSRRQFWSIISSLNSQSIVLTSHSMDEVEALCSRLGIMVNGELQCLGGVSELKSKFAQGYTLTVRLKGSLPLPQLGPRARGHRASLEQFPESLSNIEVAENSHFKSEGVDLRPLVGEICQKFIPCSLLDSHQYTLQFRIESSSFSWTQLFSTMEEIKHSSFPTFIEDYSIAQTTLEEVFLSFAKRQKESDNSRAKSSARGQTKCNWKSFKLPRTNNPSNETNR